MTQCSMFKEMKFSSDHKELNEWMPLVMEGRNDEEQVAGTFMERGTDVNFGNLTRQMFRYLQNQEGINMHFQHEVAKLKKNKNNEWVVKVKDLQTGEKRKIVTKFIFIGAGGGSLPLLEKSQIFEGKGFGGFPVSGQWLRCINKDIISKHHAKVYGKAAIGAPPMSVPHLDTRVISGKQELLFGPYAGFTTKFLKKGSYFDLLKSIKTSNLWPMLYAGAHNIPLTKYLIEQVMQSHEERVAALKDYFPNAKAEDWVLEQAGKRVQIIKKDENGKGVLQFGTEIVSSADCSLAALLGASPGASTAVSVMIELLERCFCKQINSSEWQLKIKEMIPSYGVQLNENEELLAQVKSKTSKILQLES